MSTTAVGSRLCTCPTARSFPSRAGHGALPCTSGSSLRPTANSLPTYGWRNSPICWSTCLCCEWVMVLHNPCSTDRCTFSITKASLVKCVQSVLVCLVAYMSIVVLFGLLLCIWVNFACCMIWCSFFKSSFLHHHWIRYTLHNGIRNPSASLHSHLSLFWNYQKVVYIVFISLNFTHFNGLKH